MKTIKEKILELLKDNQPRHYLTIADKLQKNPCTVDSMLRKMKMEGLLITPSAVITRTKVLRGYYQLSTTNKKGK